MNVGKTYMNLFIMKKLIDLKNIYLNALYIIRNVFV